MLDVSSRLPFVFASAFFSNASVIYLKTKCVEFIASHKNITDYCMNLKIRLPLRGYKTASEKKSFFTILTE